MKVLSFVIPAYNSEHFLDKCISSMICDEVMDRLDIIIVNDGSTDGTVSVAQKYCRQYPASVRLISQENKGHGGALNTGCAAAMGKYLKVIDADDWVETANLPVLLRTLEQCDSDVVLTHHNTINVSTGEIKKWKSYPQEFGKCYTFEEIMPQWKNFDRSLTFHGVTYKTDFYREMGIQLSEHVFYEDHEFATYPCCCARSVLPLDLFIYNYRIGDVQQSVSEENQLKRIGHTETVLRRMVAEYHKLPLAEEAAGRDYACMKTQGLLLSYLTTVMLVQMNKRAGREAGHRMMAYFQEWMPRTWGLARKQYLAYRIMNLLHISKRQFEMVLHSQIYNKLRNNHEFECIQNENGKEK